MADDQIRLFIVFLKGWLEFPESYGNAFTFDEDFPVVAERWRRVEA